MLLYADPLFCNDVVLRGMKARADVQCIGIRPHPYASSSGQAWTNLRYKPYYQCKTNRGTNKSRG